MIKVEEKSPFRISLVIYNFPTHSELDLKYIHQLVHYSTSVFFLWLQVLTLYCWKNDSNKELYHFKVLFTALIV